MPEEWLFKVTDIFAHEHFLVARFRRDKRRGAHPLHIVSSSLSLSSFSRHEAATGVADAGLIQSETKTSYRR